MNEFNALRSIELITTRNRRGSLALTNQNIAENKK